ncbi:hypothetical protein [uncultured Winogradskyella sp.]|uniref:hypothetical protein n=1 Tax=uncultured Winogradskyella sp. TaxID=395353 RepID=UPI0030DC1577|tara:strand:- start:16804 stop:17310 length:507 start_codon:yes stop_codon:yes gene_type:complete
MLLFILLIVLLLVVIYLLFVPITLYINTAREEYFIQIKGLAKASIEEDKLEVVKVHLKVLLFNFKFYPFKKIKFSSKRKIEKKILKTKKNSTTSFKKVLNVLKSFEVKKCRAEIDSGDCIFNSKLYPVFALLNFYKDTNLSVNFEGRNSVLLSLKNRPIRIIKSFINN